MKSHYFPSCKNEEGFALVIAMIMLVVLTLLGINATNNTTTELSIAGVERQAFQAFNAVDSGWQQAIPFLNRKAGPPDFINQSIASGADQIVRNFGNGTDGTTNTTFPVGTQDGIFANMMNLQYWYRVIYDSDVSAPKFGTNYRNFTYAAECNAGFQNGTPCCPAGTAGGTNEVATTVTKVYKVGY
jgi:Tfp pilus assembly protein PilX